MGTTEIDLSENMTIVSILEQRTADIVSSDRASWLQQLEHDECSFSSRYVSQKEETSLVASNHSVLDTYMT